MGLLVAILNVGCESPRDITVVVTEKNKTSGISVSYKISRDGKSSNWQNFNKTDNDGKIKYGVIKAQKGDRLEFKAEKAGYSVKVQIPDRIVGNEETIDVRLEANPITKRISFMTDPPTKGISIYGDKGGGVEKLGETDQTGSFSYNLKQISWPQASFSYAHPRYKILSNRDGSSKTFVNLDNSIQLMVYSASDLHYNMVLLNAIDRSVIVGANINIEDMNEPRFTDANGISTITLPSQYLLKNNKRIHSKVKLTISKNKFESITHELPIETVYASSDIPADTINIQPANKLNIRVVDRNANALSNVNIHVNRSQQITTNASGVAEYVYKTTRSGEVINLSLSESFLLPVNMDVTLGTIERTITITTSAFNLYLEVVDAENDKNIENVSISSALLGVTSTQNTSGRHQLLFDSIDRDYPISVADADGKYEAQEFKIHIDENNLGSSKTIKLKPKLFAHFIVKNPLGNLVSDAEIFSTNGRLGVTDKKGELTCEISAHKEEDTFRIKKSGYKSENLHPFLRSGKNEIQVRLNPLELVIILTDSESRDLIPGIPILVDKVEHVSDEQGQVIFQPKEDGDAVSIEYRGLTGTFLEKKIVYKYDFDVNSRVNFIIDPRPSIKVSTIFIDPRGNKGTIPGVTILQDGKRVGESDQKGEFTIKLNKKGESYVLEGKKQTYLGAPVNIPAARQTIYSVELILQTITATINVLDIYANQVEGLNISVDGGAPGITNKWGQAVVRLEALRVPVNIRIIDPQNRYRDHSFTHTFNEAKESTTVTVRPNPVLMKVSVGYSDGSIAIASIEVLPPPTETGKTKFDLVAGLIEIPVYKPGRYEVKYTTNDFIFGTQEIQIKLGESQKLVNFMIPNASFRVLVDRDQVVPVHVYARNSGSDEFVQAVGSLNGDGVANIDLSGPGYTEYKLVFQRPGWAAPSEEIVKLLTPEQLFNLTLGGDFLRCKQLEAQDAWEDACEACIKVSEDDPKYCDAVSTLILINRDKLHDTQKAAFYANQYTEMMGSMCGDEWQYYAIYFSLLASLPSIPENYTTNDQIVDLYQNFKNLAILQIGDQQQKNKQIESVNQSCADIACKRIQVLQRQHATTFDVLYKGTLKVEATRINEELQMYISDLPPQLKTYWDSKASEYLSRM